MYIFKAGVVGAGAMGAGIAQVISYSGLPVVLKDVDQAMLDRLQAVIRESVDGRAKIDIGAWRKTSHTGKDFLSLKPDVRDGSFARNDRGGYTVRTRTEGPPASEPPKRGLPNLDDDIPF